MSQSDSIVRTQVEALLELLEQSRNAHCREVLEQAALQAAEIRQRARKLARARVSKAVHEERQRLEHESRMVEAELNTERRRHERLRDMALIAAGRALLGEALDTRWRDADSRREWAEATLVDAASVLLGREWTLQHPVDWAQPEQEQAVAFARERCGAELQLEPTPDLETGLRVYSEGAVVDMSIPGLLANERTIEGELLAEFARATGREQS
jgi:F0F1-type ATP synthase membrane subunit b/b'